MGKAYRTELEASTANALTPSRWPLGASGGGSTLRSQSLIEVGSHEIGLGNCALPRCNAGTHVGEFWTYCKWQT